MHTISSFSHGTETYACLVEGMNRVIATKRELQGTEGEPVIIPFPSEYGSPPAPEVWGTMGIKWHSNQGNPCGIWAWIDGNGKVISSLPLVYPSTEFINAMEDA